MAKDDQYRRGMADAVIQIAARRFWPQVRVEDIGKAAGLTGLEIQAAVKRFTRPGAARKPAPLPPPVAPKPARRTSSTPKPEVREGYKWCSRGKHEVIRDEMGKNSSRPDGLSDTCKVCWREYWRERRSNPRSATG